MMNAKLMRVSALLLVCAVIFAVAQSLLVRRSYDLARKEFVARSHAEANNAFYRIQHDGSILEQLGEEVLARPDVLQDANLRVRVLTHVRMALQAYQAVPDTLRKSLVKAGMDTPFRHAVTLDTLIFRDGSRKPVVFLDAGSRTEYLRLFGDLELPTRDNQYTSFFYMGTSYYVRVSLHLHFPHLATFVFGRLKGLLVASLLSSLVFMTACLLIILATRRQERLSAMKSDFINTITHELNTPLSTITVAARNLKHEKIRSDPEALDHLSDVILRQNSRLQRMIESTMKISFLESAEATLDRESIRLNELLAGAASDLRTRFSGRELVVTETYQALQDEVLVDPALMMSAIFNLLDNAVKYSEGVPEIQIWTRNEGTSFLLGIADHGVGIERKHRSRIFEKFTRIASGGTHTVPGLGIGLFSARMIIEAHGGRITVSNRPGPGSEFIVALPTETTTHDAS